MHSNRGGSGHNTTQHETTRNNTKKEKKDTATATATALSLACYTYRMSRVFRKTSLTGCAYRANTNSHHQ